MRRSLAALNRFVLLHGIERGDDKSIVVSALTKLALLLAVLGIVGLWRFTPPPRALAASPRSEFLIHLHTPRAMVTVTRGPDSFGCPGATLEVTTADERELAAKEVTLVIAKPSAGIEPIRRSAQSQGQGIWRVDDLSIPIPGVWRVRVEILIGDSERLILEDAAQVD